MILQTLYNENREEKLELLKGLTIGQNDIVNLSPLKQVQYLPAPTHLFSATFYNSTAKIKMDTICVVMQEVLIIWGDNDRIFLLEKAQELKEYVTYLFFPLKAFIILIIKCACNLYTCKISCK